MLLHERAHTRPAAMRRNKDIPIVPAVTQNKQRPRSGRARSFEGAPDLKPRVRGERAYCTAEVIEVNTYASAEKAPKSISVTVLLPETKITE
ncbi:hypothetical protein EVAR_81881_1 [Eumeta japonica]|uniref:Uncharacterized protein n=1 Tax=Eumeta variegata TaxID=151549 RepID=A0A4C1UWV2_EUMVA|nr:hypothetical protein EVAR_81881_1 [Eumeta japonica]